MSVVSFSSSLMLELEENSKKPPLENPLAYEKMKRILEYSVSLSGCVRVMVQNNTLQPALVSHPTKGTWTDTII